MRAFCRATAALLCAVVLVTFAALSCAAAEAPANAVDNADGAAGQQISYGSIMERKRAAMPTVPQDSTDAELSVFSAYSAAFEDSPAAEAFIHLQMLFDAELRHGTAGTDKEYGKVLASDAEYYNADRGHCTGLVQVAGCLLAEFRDDYELYPSAGHRFELISHKDRHVVTVTTLYVERRTERERCYQDEYHVYTELRYGLPLIARVLRWPRLYDPIWGCGPGQGAVAAAAAGHQQ